MNMHIHRFVQEFFSRCFSARQWNGCNYIQCILHDIGMPFCTYLHPFRVHQKVIGACFTISQIYRAMNLVEHGNLTRLITAYDCFWQAKSFTVNIVRDRWTHIIFRIKTIYFRFFHIENNLTFTRLFQLVNGLTRCFNIHSQVSSAFHRHRLVTHDAIKERVSHRPHLNLLHIQTDTVNGDSFLYIDIHCTGNPSLQHLHG